MATIKQRVQDLKKKAEQKRLVERPEIAMPNEQVKRGEAPLGKLSTAQKKGLMAAPGGLQESVAKGGRLNELRGTSPVAPDALSIKFGAQAPLPTDGVMSGAQKSRRASPLTTSGGLNKRIGESISKKREIAQEGISQAFSGLIAPKENPFVKVSGNGGMTIISESGENLSQRLSDIQMKGGYQTEEDRIVMSAIGAVANKGIPFEQAMQMARVKNAELLGGIDESAITRDMTEQAKAAMPKMEINGTNVTSQLLKMANKGIEFDDKKLEALAEGTKFVDELDRIEEESDEEYARRLQFDAKAKADRQVSTKYSVAQQEVKNSYSQFVDPNTGKMSPNAERRMNQSLAKMERQKIDDLAEVDDQFNTNFEKFLRQVGTQESEEQDIGKSIADLEKAQNAQRLIQKTGEINPITGQQYTIRQARLALELEDKIATTPEKENKVKALDELFTDPNYAQKVSGNELATVFGQLGSMGDAKDYLKDRLGVPEQVIDQQFEDYQINKLGYLPELVKQKTEVMKMADELQGQFGFNDETRQRMIESLNIAVASKNLGAKSPLLKNGFLQQIAEDPGTDFIQKSIALDLLKEDQKTLKEKVDLGSATEAEKDEYFDIIRRTAVSGKILSEEEKFYQTFGLMKGKELIKKAEARGQDMTPENFMGTSVLIAAKDFLDGAVSASDLEKLYGKEGVRKIGEMASSVRETELMKGRSLNQDQRIDMSEKIQKTEAFKALGKAEPALDALLEFEKVFNQFGERIFETGVIDPQTRTVLLQAKELFNLGVLNGPDLEILEDILPQPVGFNSFITYEATVRNGIENLKKVVGSTVSENAETLDTIYGEFGDQLGAFRAAKEKRDRINDKLRIVRPELKKIEGFTYEAQKFYDSMSPEQQTQFLKETLSPKPKTEEPEQVSMTRPMKNKNPINIKRGGIGDQFAAKNEDGSVMTDDQGHLVFNSPEDGIKAGKADLQAKVSGRSRHLPDNPTILELGKVFAEDPNWAFGVAKILGVDPNTPTQDVNFNKLFSAVSRQEGGSRLLASL